MTLLLPLFPVPETPGHLMINRLLGQKKRQEVVLTVMTRYFFFFISYIYTHVGIRMNLMLVLQQ